MIYQDINGVEFDFNPATSGTSVKRQQDHPTKYEADIAVGDPDNYIDKTLAISEDVYRAIGDEVKEYQEIHPFEHEVFEAPEVLGDNGYNLWDMAMFIIKEECDSQDSEHVRLEGIKDIVDRFVTARARLAEMDVHPPIV